MTVEPAPVDHLVEPVLADGATRQFGATTFDFRRQVAVMAIINRTRDSFHDRGRTFEFDPALAAVRTALADGADWIDIGGVPFSPLAEEVTPAQEIDRVVPLVEAARRETAKVISVDTFRVETARAAIAAGATAINDTSGLRDLEMADLAAETGVALVVTHSVAAPRELLRRPRYDDVVSEVAAFLTDRARLALGRGVAPEQLVLDPGHDLNKNTLHSLELTRRFTELTALGYPLLASVSNKDFISETLGQPTPRELLTAGTVATLVACILRGARIVRVHDVAAARAAATMVAAIQGWQPPAMTRHNLD